MARGVLEWLGVQTGERILDLGCGDGQLTQKPMAAGARMVGVDSSAAMVRSARERGVEVREGEAERPPFGDAEFDAVFSNAALHWVRGQDEMMAEAGIAGPSTDGEAGSKRSHSCYVISVHSFICAWPELLSDAFSDPSFKKLKKGMRLKQGTRKSR